MRSVHFQVNIVSVIGNYHLMVAFFGGVDSVIYRPLIVL
jgi:preprotein translocase subunit SecE